VAAIDRASRMRSRGEVVGAGKGRPAMGNGAFGVKTTSEIAAEKKERSARRRLGRNLAAAEKAGERDMSPAMLGRSAGGRDYLEEVGFDAAMLRQERALGLQGGGPGPQVGAGVSSTVGKSGVDYYAELVTRMGGKLVDYGLNKALPPGSTREMHRGYEEVYIPMPPPLPCDPASLIRIDDLDDLAQIAFRGMESLNRLQSELFACAYTSSENMLVCAPTGAGKTNVAMLALLRALRQAMDAGEGGAVGMVDASEFKVIYVAPMKALAAEVVDKFGERLAPLGIVVKECTGDMQLSRTEVEKTHVMVRPLACDDLSFLGLSTYLLTY